MFFINNRRLCIRMQFYHPYDYIKLVVVMGTLCVGLYGIMKGLSSTGTSSEEEVLEKE